MDKQTVLVINGSDKTLSALDKELFHVVSTQTAVPASDNLSEELSLVLVDQTESQIDIEHLNVVLDQFEDTPVVQLLEYLPIEGRLQALELGFQDVISSREPTSEFNSRCIAAIYHAIANRQLKDNLEKAHTAAYSAMTESGNLGTNVNFLLASGHCSTLDELGQLFFRSASYYGIQCSLQIRHRDGVKNMDANGMARPLESELLTQFQGAGRYFDFGQRTICNYGCVSILIKNMPVDPLAYGAIKDNSFSLVQGLDSRVRALDEHQILEEERDMLTDLSRAITSTVENINTEYHSVMNQIIGVIENTNDQITQNIPKLMLNDADEKFIEHSLGSCVEEANSVFAEGLKINERFKELENKIALALRKMEVASLGKSEPAPAIDGEDIELF